MHPLRFILCCALLGLLAFAPAPARAGGGGGGGGPCAAYATGSQLIMRDNCFNGIAHFTAPEATLEIYNEGELPHSFTAVDGSFDSGVLARGESARVEVGSTGFVRVYCILHGAPTGEGMAGLLIVGEPAALGTGGGTGGASADAVAQQNDLVLTALDSQSAALTALSADVAALRQAAAAQAAGPRPVHALLLGVLGTVLGGSALAAGFLRRRASASPQPPAPAAAPGP